MEKHMSLHTDSEVAPNDIDAKPKHYNAPTDNSIIRIDVRNDTLINTLRPRQNSRHFPDDIFKCIFLNGNV